MKSPVEYLRMSDEQKYIARERQRGGEALTLRHANGANFPGIDDENAIPVIIAALNEEQDLPGTLLSLSYSSIPVAPLIINGHSSDRTAEFAEAFGVTVLEEPRKGKLRGVSTGLDWLFRRRSIDEAVLMTDADVILPPQWASILYGSLALMDESRPRTAAGNVLYYEDGIKPIKNALLTAMSVQRDWTAWRNGVVRAHGNSMIMHLANDAKLATELIELAYTYGPTSVWDDIEIIKTIISHNGQRLQLFDPTLQVVSRGDRYPTILSAVKTLLFDSLEYRSEHLYPEWAAK